MLKAVYELTIVIWAVYLPYVYDATFQYQGIGRNEKPPSHSSVFQHLHNGGYIVLFQIESKVKQLGYFININAVMIKFIKDINPKTHNHSLKKEFFFKSIVLSLDNCPKNSFFAFKIASSE